MEKILQLKAIITLKALEQQKVNWVMRDEPLNKEDSGWQLFYGDESEEYLEDYSNSTLITLANVLKFEPKLGKVFASQHHTFEWNQQIQDFVEFID